MKKLGTFFDSETNTDYDLYSSNALTIKAALDNSYKLSRAKIQMFNNDSGMLEDINRETEHGNLNFDKVNGEIINKDNYTPSGYARNSMFKTENEPSYNQDKNQDYYQLGFELLPLAISLPNKDIKKLDHLELLDGFRRMFCSEIPDREVLVKVYDILPTDKWCNAMLLFNSWKLVGHKQFFFDRGFKLGLWKHFDIDITLHQHDYRHDIMLSIEQYSRSDIYKTFKNNQYLDKDIKLLIKTQNHFKNKHIIKVLATLLGAVRILEFENRQAAKSIFPEDLIAYIEKNAQKHIKKINSMQVDGHIENYAKKHIYPLLLQYVRKYYGYEGDVTLYPDFFFSEWYGKWNVFKSIEEARIASLSKEIKGEIQF